MKKMWRMVLVLCFMGLGFPTLGQAQTVSHTVTIIVNAINLLAITGSPTLTVNSGTAGSQPADATDATSTYAITTNETSKKITASINSSLPTGITLSTNLAAPSGATSAGNTPLATSSSDVVTNISTVAQSGLAITYTLSATASGGVISSTSKTVTYTLTDQ